MLRKDKRTSIFQRATELSARRRTEHPVVSRVSGCKVHSYLLVQLPFPPPSDPSHSEQAPQTTKAKRGHPQTHSNPLQEALLSV